MTILPLWTALAIAAAPASEDTTLDEPTEVRVELKAAGGSSLILRDGAHRISVTLTVADPPRGWAEGLVIGPSVVDAADARRLIVQADIRVDGCRVEQPIPPIGGLSMPYAATLSARDGRWELQIFGGDGAEAYGVKYGFDKDRILNRRLLWGPDYSETTRYDVQVDRDISPQQCAS